MMNVSKHPIFAPLFFLVLFSLFKLKLCTGDNGTTVVHGCPEIEKQSLLSFKQSLHDPSNSLSSWNGDEANCCKWKGVRCSNLTGHVQQLHLQNSDLRGKVSPSLLNLKHLKYLNLSQNLFHERIPSFIGSLSSLEYLDLSSAEFHGNIPHNIGNLSNLHTLSLVSSYYVRSESSYYVLRSDSSYSLQVDSLEWLSGLSKLEYLNMNHVNLSRASNWAQQVINKLPSLVDLHLRDCSLSFTDPLMSGDVNNITTSKLVNLDLSYNQFINSSIPEWLYFFKDLEYLDLSNNNLQNIVSNSIANLTSLMTLDLSNNELSGNIPREFGNLCKLKDLYLSENKLQGGLSDLLGNVSAACFLGSLESLDISVTQLSGPLALKFGEFKRLRYLRLGSNSLSGAIPSNIGNLSSSLEELDLSDNKFTGNLPESIGQLSNLKILRIGYNTLEGVVTETHFANLSILDTFSASGNHLTLKVNPNWIPPFRLTQLILGSWNLGSLIIPPWLDTQKTSIERLDLYNTGIYGNVPNWLWSVGYLDLSRNQLHGNISFMSTRVDGGQFVFLGSNRFSGELPRVGKWLTSLDISNNSFSGDLSEFLCNTTTAMTYVHLGFLHLGGNQLTGELPNCFMKWSSLNTLHLGNNNLSGRIPNSIGFLTNLESLNLNGNNFSGHIPLSMRNCTGLQKVDLSHNNLSGKLPKSILTSLTELLFLILKSNKLSGQINPSICQLSSLQILDLSDNMFSGMIPTCLDNFTAMATKSTKRSSVVGLSYSLFAGAFIESASMSTKGMELTYDTILLLVTAIDLSKNNLSGRIPNSIGHLTNLESLNLGNNNLSGRIPNSIGFLTQLVSLNLNGNNFSGHIPLSMRNCTRLEKVDLSHNNLSGKLPKSILTRLTGLKFLIFKSNKLSGEISPAICQLSYLQILDLSDNMLSGLIPTCVNNFTSMATKNLNLYSNLYSGASVSTKGMELTYDVNILRLFTGIDLSKNNLFGHIPKEIISLVGLRMLNLSRNHLTGSIPRSIGNMTQLESLDFSINSLSGDLPISFTIMSSLEYLNVSHNNLTGRIPESTQLRGFNESSFIGNNLCGPPLTIPCTNINDGTVHSKDEKSDKKEIEWLYVFISLGYAVGLSGFLSTLYLKRSWREAYYEFFEKIWEDAYVYVLIKWRRVQICECSVVAVHIKVSMDDCCKNM